MSKNFRINVKFFYYILPVILISSGLVLIFLGMFQVIKDENKNNSDNIISSIKEINNEDLQKDSTKDPRILDGAFIDKTKAEEASKGEIKSQQTQERMQKEGKWIATDYEYKDIKKENYTVKSGDTLWEIAEAIYGNGSEWTKILESNSSSIKFLPNGQQALIIPGQILTL